MSIWSNNTINRFAQEAENEIAVETKCIIDRMSLSIIAFTSTYSVPSYVISIKRVTWLGKKLEPLSRLSYLNYPIVNPAGTLSGGAFDRLSFNNLAFNTGSFVDTIPTNSSPYAYFYSGFGENVIKIFPTPSISLAAVTNVWGSDIPNGVVLEFNRYPDVTGTTFRIPPFIRRRSIKAYVLYKCFSQEGPGQDLKAAAYWKAKYDFQVVILKNILQNGFVARMRSKTPDANRFATKISRPRLPSNFGTIVD